MLRFSNVIIVTNKKRRIVAYLTIMVCILLLVEEQNAQSQVNECYQIPANGMDDTQVIRQAINDPANSCVQFMSNTAYWIDGSQINVPANKTINGAPGNSINLLSYGPDNSRCEIVGPHGEVEQNHRHCSASFLRNDTDATGIVIDGVKVNGRRDSLEYGTRYPGGSAISFARPDGGRSLGVRIQNTTISNWPGVSIFSGGFADLEIANAQSRNPGRGGFIITSQASNGVSSQNVRFLNIESTGSGDDALAMLGVNGFLVRDSNGSTRSTNPVEDSQGKITLHGAGLALRNVRGTDAESHNVIRFDTRNAKNAGILIERDVSQGGPNPKNIWVYDSYIVGSDRNGVRVLVAAGSPYSDNIRIQSNRKIDSASGYPVVLFRNIGSGTADISPSTYHNNTQLVGTPKLDCVSVTGVTGSDGRC